MVRIKHGTIYGAEFQRAGQTWRFRPAVIVDFHFVSVIFMTLRIVLISVSSLNLSLLILHKTDCRSQLLHCGRVYNRKVLMCNKKEDNNILVAFYGSFS